MPRLKFLHFKLAYKFPKRMTVYLFQIKFDKLTPEPCPGFCMNGPTCDRKFLRLDFNLSMNNRSSGDLKMFTVGDSSTNNGYGMFHMRGSRRGRGHVVRITFEKSQKSIGYHSHTGPDSPINRKATKPAFNVGPPSARLRVDREPSCSMVECLIRDRRPAGSSLTAVTALWSLSKTHLS